MQVTACPQGTEITVVHGVINKLHGKSRFFSLKVFSPYTVFYSF